MSSFKKLSKSDVSVVPYYANKQWSFSIDCFPTSSDYLTIYKGTNLAGIFDPSSDPISQGQYERLVYAQINQLFYQEYTASLDTSSLANSLYYESASQQRPTSSYFIYNDNSKLVKNFPTGINAAIRVLAINQGVYGNKVLPGSFIISSSAYYVVDDNYGNLLDLKDLTDTQYFVDGYFNADAYFNDTQASADDLYIGNIYYAHGLAIITNQDYQLMFPTSPCIPTTTTTTTSTTSTTTTAPTTTSTTTTTTTGPTTTSTSTTTTTTTGPTTTSTTTTTTTAAPTTSTTTTTTTAAPTTSTTTSTTTAAPTTSTTTTTTTSAPPQNNFEYNYTRCSTQSTGTIIVSSALNVGDVYRSSPSGQSECYQIDSFIGTTSSSPTITLYSTVPDCSDINCVQA